MPARLTVHDEADGVRVVTLSNPSKKNAVDAGALRSLSDALDDAAHVRAWLVVGDGAAFSAGYDLGELERLSRRAPLPDVLLARVLDRLATHRAPSVAAITGPAFGAGCELAFACDFRVADASAVLCMPPAKLGVVYSAAGVARVVDAVGLRVARRLFLTGRRVAGPGLLELGLVDELVPAGLHLARAKAWCAELAQHAPLAMEGLKQALHFAARGSTAAQRARFEKLRRRSFFSDDAKEGVRAAKEKRAPTFRGR